MEVTDTEFEIYEKVRAALLWQDCEEHAADLGLSLTQWDIGKAVQKFVRIYDTNISEKDTWDFVLGNI